MKGGGGYLPTASGWGFRRQISMNLLVNPATPPFLLSLAGIIMSVLCLQARRPKVVGLVPTPSTWNLHQRYVFGQSAGAVIASILILAAWAQSAAGMLLYLILTAAFAIWLYLGLVLPRKAHVDAQKRSRAIRRLTPAFISYVRIAVAGYDSPAVILERYSARTDKRSAPMREVTMAALRVMQQDKRRPFEALRDQARLTGCQELLDVAEAMAQAESEGANVTPALIQHEQTLRVVLENEFRQLLARRGMILMLLAAIGLVVGELGNLLFVMVAPVLFGGSGL